MTIPCPGGSLVVPFPVVPWNLFLGMTFGQYFCMDC